MPGLLLGKVLSVFTCWFRNVVTLPCRLVSTNFGTWSYQCSLSNFTPISVHMLECSWPHTLSCFFLYCSFAYIGHANKMWSVVSSNCWNSLHLLSLLFVIYLLHDILFVICCIISLSVSCFRSPLHSHRNVSSSVISCPSLLVYWLCITLLSYSCFRNSPNFVFCMWYAFSCYCFYLFGFILLQPML